ncbi:MAG: hypothetical protein WCG29_01655, partial [Desulfomonile sp.]
VRSNDLIRRDCDTDKLSVGQRSDILETALSQSLFSFALHHPPVSHKHHIFNSKALLEGVNLG